RRILEDRDGLDVVRIDEGQRVGAAARTVADADAAPGASANRNAVDDIERVGSGAEGGRAANADRETATGLVVVDDLDAGHLVLDECLRRDDVAGVEVSGG